MPEVGRVEIFAVSVALRVIRLLPARGERFRVTGL